MTPLLVLKLQRKLCCVCGSVWLNWRKDDLRANMLLWKARVCLTLLCQIICTLSTPTLRLCKQKVGFVSFCEGLCTFRCVGQHRQADVNQMMPLTFHSLIYTSIWCWSWVRFPWLFTRSVLLLYLEASGFVHHLSHICSNKLAVVDLHKGKGLDFWCIVNTQHWIGSIYKVIKTCFQSDHVHIDRLCRQEASWTPAVCSSYFWDCCGLRSHYRATQGRDFSFLRPECWVNMYMWK